MRPVGLASCRPLPVEDSTVNDFTHHTDLLQKVHFAASVKRGRSFEIRAGPSTHTGTRVQASQAEH